MFCKKSLADIKVLSTCLSERNVLLSEKEEKFAGRRGVWNAHHSWQKTGPLASCGSRWQCARHPGASPPGLKHNTHRSFQETCLSHASRIQRRRDTMGHYEWQPSTVVRAKIDTAQTLSFHWFLVLDDLMSYRVQIWTDDIGPRDQGIEHCAGACDKGRHTSGT